MAGALLPMSKGTRKGRKIHRRIWTNKTKMASPTLQLDVPPLAFGWQHSSGESEGHDHRTCDIFYPKMM
jgi:hypothetical protein